MKHTFSFLLKIVQLALITCITYVLPAVMHCLITLNLGHYLNDIQSVVYCGVMSFVCLMVTIFYMVVVSEQLESQR
jgi:hypothetical protein